MSDLSAKLSHLQALREGATKGPWTLGAPHWHRGTRGRDCKQPIQAGSASTIAVALRAQCKLEGGSAGRAGQPPLDSIDGRFIVALVNASPWLIPLAQQAAKLAEALFEALYTAESSEMWNAAYPGFEATLSEFEAIKKEAESV